MAAENSQIIAKLTPLADVLALIEAQVGPVAPRRLDVAAAGVRLNKWTRSAMPHMVRTIQ